MESKELFEAHIKVRTYECDSYGHVNNAVYLNYLEIGRMAALNQKGFSLANLKQKGLVIVVRRIEIDYKAPATEGDELLIRTYIKDHSKMKGVFRQEILKASDRVLVARADVTWVFVNLEGRLIAVPEFFSTAFGF